MPDKISVVLSPDRIKLRVGETAKATATIRNTSDVVESYSLSVEGISPQWYSLSISSVSLFPGDQTQVQLTINLPATTESKAGAYEVRLKTVSNRDPAIATSAQLSLEIERQVVFEINLTPKKAKGREGSYRLSITNNGNTSTTYSISAQDPDDMCQFEFKKDTVVIDPGRTAAIPLVVSPKKKPFTGGTASYSFKIFVMPQTGQKEEGKSVDGEFECKPSLSKWALAAGGLVLVAVIAAIAAAVIIFAGGNGHYRPTPTYAPLPINYAPVISSLTASQNSVGLGNSITVTCTARDQNGDSLSYQWTSCLGTNCEGMHTLCGSISGTGSAVTWTAPSSGTTPRTCTIKVTVSDGHGGTATRSIQITVTLPFVPFTPTPTPFPFGPINP